MFLPGSATCNDRRIGTGRCWRKRRKALDLPAPRRYNGTVSTQHSPKQVPDYTLAEAARALGISKTQTKRLRAPGGPLLPQTKPIRGRVCLIDGASLHALLAERGRPIPTD